MKRKIVAVFLVGISILSTGCVGSFRGNARMADSYGYTDEYDDTDEYDTDAYNDDYDNEEDGSMTEREMTQEQIDLLCSISVNEDKVREGKLADWQVEVLNQYDYAMEYLAEKYPSYEFGIVGCDQKCNLSSYTTFTFIEKGDKSAYYDLYLDVYEEESGNRYEAKDNFYGKLFEEELAEKMLELMQDEFPECIKVTTNVTCAEGEEFGENLDIESVLTGERSMEHDTDFYIDAEGMTETEYTQKVADIKEFILKKGIYGSYDVKFVNKADLDKELYREHFFGE